MNKHEMKQTDIAIYAEHVSKRYRLGVIGSTTLKADLQTRWALFRGREDPNSKIGEENVKNGILSAVDGVSLTIRQGERVGLIGKNGSGKSTLLKLICRITAPTDGFIGHNGKVTSMLEVGTGFHPELTGRENIYLSGSIIGMSKEKIDEKFDDIVAFSEMERFIDTPVKRYSSGMYVRLAFSVSAHLNADIVIMDEVLAVGDTNFQEKCIRRMRSIAETEGKTIIYVSHNMQTIHALCERCLVMDHGKLVYDGNVTEAEAFYRGRSGFAKERDYSDPREHEFPGNHIAEITKASFDEANPRRIKETLPLRIKWEYRKPTKDLHLRIEIRNASGQIIGSKLFWDIGDGNPGDEKEETFRIGMTPLYNGRYQSTYVLYQVNEEGENIHVDVVDGLDFEIHDQKKDLSMTWHSDYWGSVRL